MKKLLLLMAVAMLTASAGGCRNACGWRHSWFKNNDCCNSCCPTYDTGGCNSCGTTYGGSGVIYGGAPALPGPAAVQPTP